MPSILVVYATDYNNTKTAAEAFAEGARGVSGTTVTVKTADEATWQDINVHDALVLGTPVHMGSARLEGADRIAATAARGREAEVEVGDEEALHRAVEFGDHEVTGILGLRLRVADRAPEVEHRQGAAAHVGQAQVGLGRDQRLAGPARAGPRTP